MHLTTQSVGGKNRQARLAVLIQLGTLILAAPLARPEGVVTVCTEETLIAALKGGGQITFGCSGTLSLSDPIVIQQNTTLDASTNSVVLTPQLTNRLFLIRSGAHLTLQGLTLRGGYVIGAIGADGGPGEDGRSGQPAYGAAVFNDGGFLTAIDTRFTSHIAQGGNGGRGADGDAVQTRGRSGGDGGEARGAALYNNGRAELLRCVFEDNAAFGGAGGNGGDASTNLVTALGGDGGDGGAALGGAIFCPPGAQLFIQDCSFARNTAAGEIAGSGGLGVSGRSFPAESGKAGIGSGGAVGGQDAFLTFTGSAFLDNFADGANGWSGLDGLEARSGQDGFSGASASGGALSVAGGITAVTNCTLFANGVVGGDGGDGGAGGSADLGAGGGDGGRGGSGLGGAVRARQGAQVVVVNCTLSLNEAHGGHGGMGGAPGTSLQERGDRGAAGSALGSALAGDDANIVMVNVILDGEDSADCVYGPLTDEGHNLCSDDSANFTQTTSRNGVDPRVAWLADNGGPTLTAALKPDSPAIDQGDDQRAPPTDQRGQARIGPPDIGAFEFESAAAVPTLDIQAEDGRWVITWPSTLSGWRLQSTQEPASGDWTDVEDIKLDGMRFVHTGDPLLNQTRYYRLTR